MKKVSENKIRLFLNLANRDSNIILDQKTGVRFSLSNPYVEVLEVSEGIRRSISSGTVIDIDGVTGIEVKPHISKIHDRVLQLAGIVRTSKVSNDTKADVIESKVDAPVDTKEEVTEEVATEEVTEEQPKEKKSTTKKTSKKKDGEK